MPAGTPWGGGASGAQAQPAARQGGGFLAGAAQTAVGVAGGMMLGSMLGSMFGGAGDAIAGEVNDAADGLAESRRVVQTLRRDPGRTLADALRRAAAVVGRAGAFLAEQQGVVGLEDEIGQGRRALGRKQHQTPGRTIRLEGLPIGVAGHVRQRAVVEGRALHGAVVETEARRLDHMQIDAETGRQSDAGSDVLRNVRLKKGETHSKPDTKRRLGICRGLLRAFRNDVSPFRRGAERG